MGDLIERLEAATVGSRELDAELWDLIDPRPRHDLDGTGAIWKRDPDDGVAFDGPPSFTGSLDAALALAERVLGQGFFGIDLNIDEHGGSRAIIEYRHASYTGKGLSAALALCAAILRAIPEDKS